MSSVAKLWARIEEAKQRLGATDEAQIKQIQGINTQVKEVRAGLAERYRELERHREEVSKLRGENEQLKRMLHRLLTAIEQRSTNPLKEMMRELAGDVSAMAPLAAVAEVGAQPTGAPKQDPKPAGTAKRPAIERLGGSVAATPAPAADPMASTAIPSEKDSRWLHEIMERAQELSADGGKASRPSSTATSSHGTLN